MHGTARKEQSLARGSGKTPINIEKLFVELSLIYTLLTLSGRIVDFPISQPMNKRLYTCENDRKIEQSKISPRITYLLGRTNKNYSVQIFSIFLTFLLVRLKRQRLFVRSKITVPIFCSVINYNFYRTFILCDK